MGAMSFRLQKGDLILLDDAPHEWVEANVAGAMLRPVNSNGLFVSMTHEEMKEAYFGGENGPRLRILRQAILDVSAKTKVRLDREFAAFSVANQDKALARLEYLQFFERAFRACRTGNRKVGRRISKTEDGFARAGRICAWVRRRETAHAQGVDSRTLPLERYSGATLRRWYRIWKKTGQELNALIPDHASKGPSAPSTMTREVESVVAHHIRRHYLTLERMPLSVVYELIERTIRQSNERKAEPIEIPSLSTVRRWKAANVSEYEEMYHREGKKAAEHEFRNVRKTAKAQWALETIEIDHTLMDTQLVYCYRKGRGGKAEPILRRPWLTVAVDRATSMIFGYYISFEAPSWTSVMACLRMAVLPKDNLVKRLACQSDWPLFGLPEAVVLDGGLEFRSRSMKAAAGQLGFELCYTPRRQPHLKGKIERLNGEVARNFLSGFPGRTFANVQERGDYPSEKLAAMTLADLEENFGVWAIDYYHNHPHRKHLMQTPLQVLEQKAGIGVRLPPSVDQLNGLIGLTIERTIQPEGIEYLGLFYKSPILASLKRRPGHIGKLWMVKCDPMNMESVLILDEEGGKWLSIPSDDKQLTKDLTLAGWKKIKDAARANTLKGERVSRDRLLAARERLQAAGENFGAGSTDRMKQDVIDWANQYLITEMPDVAVGREVVPSPDRSRRRSNRKAPSEHTGKVSERTGMAIDDQSDPVVQSVVEVASATEKSQRPQSGNVTDYDDPENWS